MLNTLGYNWSINILSEPNKLNTKRLLAHYKTERKKFDKAITLDKESHEYKAMESYLKNIKIELDNRENIY